MTVILIVEDESIVARDIQDCLERLGYRVTDVTASGEEAVRVAEGTRPDLVLMDIVLKGAMDGIEAAQIIYSRWNIPIVYLTAYGDDPTLQRAQQAAPFGYILKPFQERDLRATIETALHKHEMERRLRESERWLAITLQSIGDGVIATDANGSIALMNGVAEDLSGWKLAEAMGQDSTRVFHILDEDHALPAEHPIDVVLREGRPFTLDDRYRLSTKGGAVVEIGDSLAPIKDEHGEVKGSVLVFRSIGEQKRMQEALRRSEERLRSIFESASIGMAAVTPDGRFVQANPALCRMLGYSEPELLALSLEDVIHPDDRAERGVTCAPDGLEVERRLLRRDGKVLWGRTNETYWSDASGKTQLVALQVVDVTRQRELEERLQHTQRMEALGRLAGGVAHDFNNVLTVILAHTELLLSTPGTSPSVLRRLEEVQEAATRAVTLTRQLLAFSRKQVLELRVLDVGDVLSGMEGMLRRLVEEPIQLEIRKARDLGRVRADKGQLEQVVLNLALNARDAMPEGGRLTIETANAELDEATARELGLAKAGHYVVLSVRDTGLGMEPEVRARMFEPFFTTKDLGKGTGLGLATVYGIVRQCAGHVRVESEPGRGSALHVLLPRVFEAPQEASPAEAARPRPSGAETVLLVEDEEAIRDLVAHMLSTSGYSVLSAPSGAEALRLLEERGGPIHLLLTDSKMPGMSGAELAARLVERHPEVRTLFMSGFPEDTLQEQGALFGAASFLPKPFNARTLIAKVREVLDR